MIITNLETQNVVAPNPTCCTDADVLCWRCAREVLNTIADDEADLLVPPTMNWAGERKQQPTTPQQQFVMNDLDDILLMPTMDWN